ncbi:helix-turn-helix transcriptional regulator [Lawsonibacter sp. NSJ-52]|uniref:Helix-turn-helix transcriptional regulator n=2 Tax=Lawsonibacter faecis TaxID=2763052 RepID=A0A8J6J9H0_9FIRM|nr:helix-turn-helix transcriptional regulator [Lawsonibacter faecis]MBC5736108.1 helix-turn-helix transcriptional regulator [Lawsonibacter faecis]
MDVMKVVQNIQELCNSKGVKPTVAARESGAGKDLITNMKKRGTQPSIEKIRLLAEYLGCSVSDILGEKEKEPTIVSDDGHAAKLAQALRDIGIDVAQLSEADVRKIAKLAKTLFEE